MSSISTRTVVHPMPANAATVSSMNAAFSIMNTTFTIGSMPRSLHHLAARGRFANTLSGCERMRMRS